MVNVIPSAPRLRRSLLALLVCLHVASACIQCDRRVREEIDDYIVSKTVAGTEDRDKYESIRDQAYRDYTELASEISDKVIDPTTLYRVTTDFLNAFKEFVKKKSERTEKIDFIIMMGNKGGKILEKHLNAFVHEGGGVCPNKCGLLRRKVKSCSLNNGVCPNELRACSEQLDCGERVVRATEDDQVVLDCLLPWHGLVSGRKEYRYSWAKGTPAAAAPAEESDFKRLLVTEESGMVLNQVQPDQRGTYRCELLSEKTKVLSRSTFRLHVAPAPTQTTLRPSLTLPTLPPGALAAAPRSWPHRVCVALTAVSLAGSVAMSVFLAAMMRRHARRLAGED